MQPRYFGDRAQHVAQEGGSVWPSRASVQITFHEDKAPERHSMPPGGFRVAIVNAFDLEQGEAAREALRKHFLGAEPAVNIQRAR